MRAASGGAQSTPEVDNEHHMLHGGILADEMVPAPSVDLPFCIVPVVHLHLHMHMQYHASKRHDHAIRQCTVTPQMQASLSLHCSWETRYHVDARSVFYA